MKVLIIEDEAPAFRRLQKILEEIDPQIEIIDVLDSVEESIKWFNYHKQPDLIFSDIQLSDGISFDIYEKIKITKPIIFTTAFDEYTLKAFKINSIDYLLKPIKKEELQRSLEKYALLKHTFSNPAADLTELIKDFKVRDKEYKSRFLVKMGDKLISVQTGNIAYFHSQNKLIHIYTREKKKYVLDLSLDEIQNQLDPHLFFRANRQFLIQFDSIQVTHKYHKGKLLLDVFPPSSEKIIISAEKASEFKAWMDR